MCGKVLEGKPSVVKRRKYCSLACSGKAVGFQKGHKYGIKSRFKGGERKGLGIRNKQKMDYMIHRLYLLYKKTAWKYVDEHEFCTEIKKVMRDFYER